MEIVIVERSFEQPLNLEEMSAREAAVAWCLQELQVRPRESWVASDGLRAVCLYDAPDAEAVRTTQRTSGLPFDKVWSGRRIPPSDAEQQQVPDAYAFVVVLRELPEAVSNEQVVALKALAASCHELRRVTTHCSFLDASGTRLICAYHAPDAESVRAAQHEAKLPFVAAWPARLMRL